MVNNRTHIVYSIIWDKKQANNLKDILGTTYYPKFEQASKNPSKRIPLRGIVIDDGNLTVSQFGSMLSGIHGIASVKSIAP
jgi:hypothetical protein